MSDFLDRIASLDFGELWLFLSDVLRNPTSNLVAFVLILIAITVVMLLLIVILLYVFSGSEDEEEHEEYDESDFYDPDRPDEPYVPSMEVEEPALVEVVEPVEPRRRVSKLVGLAIWLVIVGAVWLVGGWVSSANTLCISCHMTDSIHKARIEGTAEDPHTPVACVTCHESPNQAAIVTTAVPGRAAHFITGMIAQRWARDYGTPVANSACASCHEKVLSGTVEDTVRGLKVSHAEPLAARARCADCHVPDDTTGIIGRFTVGMEPCLRCHDSKTASAECSYCHTKDVGAAAQSRGKITARNHLATLDCGGCHSQEKCDACHGTRLPHSPTFLGPGHARQAVEDVWFNGGKVCSRCHTQTRRPCMACHSGPFPSHSPQYMIKGHQTANPYNNGCDSCHGRLAWDAQRNYCALCHDRYRGGLKVNGD